MVNEEAEIGLDVDKLFWKRSKSDWKFMGGTRGVKRHKRLQNIDLKKGRSGCKHLSKPREKVLGAHF